MVLAPTNTAGAARIAGLLASLLAALGLLAGLELMLRGAGFAPGISSLKYQRVYPPLMRPTTLPDGRPALGTVDPRLPFQWVDPENTSTLRIACFGGSATAGLGLAPSSSFPAELEECLRDAFPDRSIEVLNFGVVAISSKQVRTLVADACANLRLDAVVVYSGNNEFLELHSKRFAQAKGIGPSRVETLLASSALMGLIRGTPPEPSPTALEASITTRNLARNDARVEHSQMMNEVRLTEGEVEAVLDDYEDNLRAMASSARAAGVPILLCTVAANWRWTGKQDESREWLVELGLDPNACAHPAFDWAGVVELAAARAEQIDEPLDHWHWLCRAAHAADQAGDAERAAGLWAQSMEQDPHLRRATARHAERVRRVAESEAGVDLVDLADFLGQFEPGGLIGFDAFYDYVHFTPEAALIAAETIAVHLSRAGVTGPFEPNGNYAARRREFLASDAPDHLDVNQFVGFGPDRELLASRDLWRYDHLADQLDAAIEADPTDWRALTWRGNIAFSRPLAAATAEADYRAALAIEEHPAVRANLERLASDRRP